MGELTKSETDFQLLSEYLVFERGLPGFVSALEVRHDPQQDRVNKKDARAFCYVRADDLGVIYCSKSIEAVEPEVRVAILLHEIGHIVLDAFTDDESEVDVDTWVDTEVPEAGYTYKDVTYERAGRRVTGKNVQWVTPKFVREIHGRSSRSI